MNRVHRRLQRPAWLGVERERRAAFWPTVGRLAAAAGGRLAYELLKGIWLRAAHLIRWYFLGMKGWIPLIAWVFAIGERDAMPRSAPKTQRKPGQAGAIGRRADRLAWIRGGVLVVPHIAGAVALHHYLGSGWQYLVFVPGVVATTIYGRVHDEKPPPPVVAPRHRSEPDIEQMTHILRSLGVLAKPTAGNPSPPILTVVRMSFHDGLGREYRYHLPADCGSTASAVVAMHEQIAAALGLHRNLLVLEEGAASHEFVIWVADRDPFAGPPPESPLLDVYEFDVWARAPFMLDKRGRIVTQCLVFSSKLNGSRPRRGKTFAARNDVAPAVLDPSVRIYCWNLKGDEAWDAIREVCELSGGVYGKGRRDDALNAMTETLERLTTETDERNERIPGSKLTRQSSRDPKVAAPVTFVIVDEVQRAFESQFGDRIDKALTDLAKNGPSAGFVLDLSTQRPDADSFPSGLRAQLGARFALQVMSHDDSNVILGPDMSKRGFNAALITQRGVGILRPDDDADGEMDDEAAAKLGRTFDMSDPVWEAICERGAELRRAVHEDVPELEAGPSAQPLLPGEILAWLRENDPDVAGRFVGANGVGMALLKAKVPFERLDGKKNGQKWYPLGQAHSSLRSSLGLPELIPESSRPDEPGEPAGDIGTSGESTTNDLGTTRGTTTPHLPTGTTPTEG